MDYLDLDKTYKPTLNGDRAKIVEPQSGNPAKERRYKDSAGNEVYIVFGSKAAGTYFGSPKDDVAVLGPEIKVPGIDATMPMMSGKSGHDTLVLQGAMGDYRVTLPDSAEVYPRGISAAWKNQNTLYGSMFIFENVKTKEKISVQGFETIVFDRDSKVIPAVNLGTLQTGLQSGELQQVSRVELLVSIESAMASDAITMARLYATTEASKIVDEKLSTMDYEQAVKAVAETISQLMSIDVNNRVYTEDAPVNSAPLQALGIKIPVLVPTP